MCFTSGSKSTSFSRTRNNGNTAPKPTCTVAVVRKSFSARKMLKQILFLLLFLLVETGIGQVRQGNILVHVLDKEGKPYDGCYIKLKTFSPESGLWIPYGRLEGMIDGDWDQRYFEQVPQGKYQLYVECMRTQTEATKEFYFTPVKKVTEVTITITLPQKQYWRNKDR